MIGGLIEDPRPSIISKVIHSAFGEDIRELEEKAFKGGTSMSVSSRSRSISQFAGEQKLGWPLLRRASHSQSREDARDVSVVQWAMNLPDRSPQQNPHRSTFFEDDSYQIFEAFNCKLFPLELLKSCTCQFSSG